MSSPNDLDASKESYLVNLNQDFTSLVMGMKNGFQIFALNSLDKLEKVYESEREEVLIVERLFSSSLVAVVALSSPRILKICHFKKGTEICNYSYSNTILSVKLNRSRLIVCLEEALYIHDIHNMKVLHTIKGTPSNVLGLCALSNNADCSFLAYPGSSQIGEIQIFDATNLLAKTMIPAHHSSLVALSFSSSGSRIASASEKGTVIRVFNVQDGSKAFEFRRGITRCVTIYSLVFGLDDQYLCTSSSTETVHVFKLEEDNLVLSSQSASSEDGWMSYLSKAVSLSASYFSSQVTEVLFQGRSFAYAKLPFSGIKSVCGITIIGKQNVILVATANGYLYMYSMDAVTGGTCALLKQHRFSIDPRLSGDTCSGRPKVTDQGAEKAYNSEQRNETMGIGDPPSSSKFNLDDYNDFPPMGHQL